jgi:hypothetical protein
VKHLIITTPRGNLPPDVAGPLFSAAKQWMSARRADGTLDVVHAFPAGGGVAIANSSSHEELMERIRGFPLFAFVEWDIRPLVDIDQSFDSAIQMFKKMAGG